MTGTLLTVTLAAALGQMPYGGGGGAYTIPTGPAYGATGPAYGAGMSGGPAVGGPPPVTATGGSNGYEQLYPFDAYENWMRGQFQDIPAYGGFHGFRPYNYKHVLSQSQVAGGWGMSPSMPYSHDYFRRAQGITATRDPRYSQTDASLLNDLARLRAAQAGQAPLAVPARSYYGSIAPAGADAAASRNVDSALHMLPPPTRTDDLQEQLSRQALHLQSLQNPLPQEYQQGPTLRLP